MAMAYSALGYIFLWQLETTLGFCCFINCETENVESILQLTSVYFPDLSVAQNVLDLPQITLIYVQRNRIPSFKPVQYHYGVICASIQQCGQLACASVQKITCPIVKTNTSYSFGKTEKSYTRIVKYLKKYVLPAYR